MTEKELRAWMRKESLTDTWFVSAVDGHVDSNLQTLSGIFERYAPADSQKKSVWILHESQQNRKDPAWIELELDSFGSENPDQAAAATGSKPDSSPERHNSTSSRRSRRSQRRSRGVIIQLIVLLVVLVIGAGAWYAFTREEPERISFVTEEEAHSRMLATLQQNLLRNNPDASTEEGEPIRTVVSATQRMLMIKNSNLENWPSFGLRITTADGQTYSCTFDESIPAYSTLSISMRKIQTSKGVALTREDLKSGTTIELSIPGYKTWSSKL